MSINCINWQYSFNWKNTTCFTKLSKSNLRNFDKSILYFFCTDAFLNAHLHFPIFFQYLNSLDWSRAVKKCLICHNFLFSQTQFRKKTFKLLQIFVYYFSRAQGLSKKGTPNIFLGRRDVSSNILFNIVYCQFYFGLYRYPCRREHSLSVLITYFSTLLVGFLTIV